LGVLGFLSERPSAPALECPYARSAVVQASSEDDAQGSVAAVLGHADDEGVGNVDVRVRSELKCAGRVDRRCVPTGHDGDAGRREGLSVDGRANRKNAAAVAATTKGSSRVGERCCTTSTAAG
jgi:hypothetical protein